ncbi:MAG: ATP-binding cassette domain-containing protein [Actinobacteria bacterium]|nr:ATP-binding cassette domain-containing protein [Actinomycetota bacterium]
MEAAKESVIEASNLTKKYGEGETEVTALRNVSLEVKRGEVVLIMGPSGSGKTTLLSILGALLKPSSGSVSLGGEDIAVLSESELPDVRLNHLGFIFQDFNLLSALTARENVEVVLNLAGVKGAEARKRAEAFLTDLGLGERLDFRPEKLSGGEKQRVAIARALANEPDILLCDEPTANLDSKIGHDIIRRLQQIAKNQRKSVVIVSHDARIKEHADRVLWLEDGEFKQMAVMEHDPVCEMSIEREKAAASVTYKDKTYYFCSKGCAGEFQENPEKFIAGEGAHAV